MKNPRKPAKITLDAYAASHRAVREMKERWGTSAASEGTIQPQDHRRVKQRIRLMLGFKRFDNAVVTISGIELAEKIKKGQFKLASWAVRRRPCQNYGTQHSLPDAYREQ
jgi:transposase-like protein